MNCSVRYCGFCRRSVAALCGLLLMVSVEAFAERWISLDGAEGDAKAVLMDLDSVEVRSGFHVAVIKTEYRFSRRGTGGLSYDLLIQKLVQDCEGRHFALISGSVFNNGIYLYSISNSEAEWKARLPGSSVARPGTPAGRLLDYICKAPVAVPEDPGRGSFDRQVVSQLSEAPPPAGEQWKLVENAHGSGKQFIDLGSVYVVGDYRTVIQRVDFPTTVNSARDGPHDSIMQKWAVDCQTRRYAIISVSYLLATKATRSGSYSDGEWARSARELPVGDVYTQRMMDEICAARARPDQ
jgi:hypothetical protein